MACVVHCFKQERGQKRVSTALVDTAWVNKVFFYSSLAKSVILKKIMVVSIKHFKQKLTLKTTTVDVIMTFTSPKHRGYLLF